MTRPARLVTALAACFAASGTLVVLVMTRDGPGVSPDSATYLSAADSVVSTGTFRGYLPDSDLSLFGPLYPLLLVPGTALDVPLGGARLVGALAFGLLIAVGVIGAARIDANLVFPAVTGVGLLLSIPLVRVASFAWSDAPFALLVGVFLLAVSTIGTGRNAVLVSGVTAGTATLLRYIGATTIPIGLLAIVVWSRSRRRDLSLFFILAILGPAVWVTRNLLVSSTLTGDRHSAADDLEVAIRDTARTIGTWLHVGHPNAALALAGVLALAAMSTLRQHPLQRLELVSFAFCAVYCVWLVSSTASVALDPIADRFVAPIYVPLAWLAVSVVRRLSSITVPRIGPALSLAALLIVFGAWASSQMSRFPNLREHVELSSVKHLPQWTAADEDRAHRISGSLYSNAPHAVYLRTGTRVSYAPRRSAYRSGDPFDEIRPLREKLVTDESVALIWFRDVTRHAVYSPPELRAYFEVARVATTPSATLYRIGLSSSEGREVEGPTTP